MIDIGRRTSVGSRISGVSTSEYLAYQITTSFPDRPRQDDAVRRTDDGRIARLDGLPNGHRRPDIAKWILSD